MARTLRSATRAAFESASSKYDEDGTPLPVDRATLATSSPTLILTSGIKLTPPAQVTLPALDAEETRILRRKQQRLRLSTQSTTRLASRYGAHITNSLHATYIFAQHEAGTAVCVDPRGWLVTCAHCFGESEAEWRAHRTKWLVADSGVAVQAECRAWDVRRDLALARIIGVEGATVPSTFAFVSLPALEDRISDPMMFEGTSIVCIGQPGADDLESEKPRKTDYALLEISEGELRGIISGADPQDNSEIGTLKHDAWTTSFVVG
ncbi:hypothetical protein BJX64DRAFT_291294 [Aspergillus heterothallicus]